MKKLILITTLILVLSVGYFQTTKRESLNLSGIDSGMIGYWPLDTRDNVWTSGTTGTTENRGSTGLKGTFTSMTQSFSANKVGVVSESLRFDGSNDRIITADFAAWDGATTVSACAWVKPVAFDVDLVFLSKRTTGIGLLFWRDDEAALSGRTETYSVFMQGDGGDSARVEGATGIGNSPYWTHVCFTLQAANTEGMRLYINGVEDPNSPVDTSSLVSWSGNSNSMNIGANPNGTLPFNGYIDDVRIYTRILSREEIQVIYRQCITRIYK
jgi:hypothetical protein